jgi:putative ABC transport system permease protein
MRVYRALLRLLPLEFRDRFGRDLEDVFRAQQREAADTGTAGRLGLWLETLSGLLLVAPREHLSILRQDTVLAWRMMRRRPALSIAAVSILAIALGATTAVFSVVNAVILRPLPYPAPERIVVINERDRDGSSTNVSPPMLRALRAEARQLAHVAALVSNSLPMQPGGAPLVDASEVTAGYFEVYGVQPAHGRLLRAAPIGQPQPDEALLTHDYWTRQYAGDPRAVGQRLALARGPAVIVGVLPRDFRRRESSDVYVPLAFTADALRAGMFGATYLDVVGRLAPGAEPAAAQAELTAIAARARAAAGFKAEERGVFVTRLHDVLIAGHRTTLWLMFGTVTLVLLVAAANVSSLLLVNAVTREEELAIRAALGASAVRLFRQVLTESLVLASLASLGALGVAALVLRPLVARLPPGLPRLNEIGLDWRVLAFAAAAALVLGTLLGLAPAARVSARRLFRLLTTAGRQASSRESAFARRALLALEVAATFVLLVAGVLMTQRFLALQRADLGFSPDNVVTAFVSLPPDRYATPEHQRVFARRLLEETRAIHGATAAGIDCNPPLGFMTMWFGYQFEDRPAPKGDRMSAQFHCVDGRSFAAFGTRILDGRAFDERDGGDTHRVVIINEWMAKRYWPGQSPVGRRIMVITGSGYHPREIVGIASSRRHQGLVEPETAELYVPLADHPSNNLTLAVRVDGARDTAPARVREALARVDPALGVVSINWMSEDVAALLAPYRFQALLMGAFALTALLLSLVCIHGVTTYVVSLRKREMGVRIALGASPGRVTRLVIADALRPIAVGVVLGIAAAVGLSRALRLDLAGLNVATAGTADPLTLALAVAILLVVALGATWIPARRATRVDPLTALRQA